MLARLIAFSLAQRLLIAIAVVLLTIGGYFAFKQLPIDAFPDVSNTQVKIILKAPGMTPEEVESRIVAPVEQELLGIPKQSVLRSISKYAIADITLDFEEGTDVFWARQQVGERLNNALKDLPASVSGGLAPITTPLGEIFMFTIEGPQTLMDKRSILEWTIRPLLRNIPGVADVNSLGGQVRSFEIVPDVDALAARGLSLSALEMAIESNNRNDGAGRLNSGEESLLVRSDGNIRTLEDLKSVAISEKNGTTIRVGDVAEVRIGALTRYGVVTSNGKGEAVEGLVLGMRGANASEVVKQVSASLDALAPSLPKGMQIRTFYDRGTLVGRATSTVIKALAEASILVVILLYVFLGNLRSALVVTCILPLSALSTFILMKYFGLSANLMSLGGLAIAIGMLVDAAVVVVENIEATPGADTNKGIPRLHSIYRAVREVALPVSSGISVIMIVFLPLLTLQGLEGKLFAPVAFTILFALGSSLLLSLTAIPVLASWLLKDGHHKTPMVVEKMEIFYRKTLLSALSHQRLWTISAGCSLLIAVLIFPFLGKSFMPVLDEGDIILQIEKLPSVNLEETAHIDTAVQKRILEKIPEITAIIARAGSDELGLDPMGLNETDSFLVLKPKAEWGVKNKAELMNKLREVTSEFPGINFSITQPIEMRTSEMLSGVRGDLAVKIFGPDPQVLNQLSEQISKILGELDGAQDVMRTQNEGVQYLQVEIDRARAGRFGLSVVQIQNDLRVLVEGKQNGIVRENAQRVPVLIRGSENLRMSPDLFTQIRLPLQGGGSIALSEIASLKAIDGPVKIERQNASRLTVVRANVKQRDLVSFVSEAQATVAKKVTLPPGYRLSWGGQFENQQRAAQRLMVVVPVAITLIFLLLFSSLQSLRQALLVLANIPFALIGGIVALGVSGEYLSVPASVGFIALMGISVLNGLVMISYFNQLKARGAAIQDVVTEGAVRRFRPVMMTASITAFGLIPLLLASGPGSEIQKPLAIVVIGGLISATALTLFLLPILFSRFGYASNALIQKTNK